MTVNFSDVYRTCNKLFLHSMDGKTFPTTHYITKFFEQAEKLKDIKTGEPMHTAAIMALQQAFVDTAEIAADEYNDGVIEYEDFQNRNYNLHTTDSEMLQSEKMKELYVKIIQQHKKTGAKRLAILPNLMDSNENGLGMVKRSAGFENIDTLLYKIAKYIVLKFNPAIVSLEEEIIENKPLKMLNYLMFKYLFTPFYKNY